MKHLLRLGFFLGLPLLAEVPAEIEKLAFFTGCWETRSGQATIEEQWNRPSGGTLLGTGRTVRNGKTVSTEFLRIEVEKGKLTYTARIGTPGVTPFPLLRLSATEVVFENPEHDFPQRVIYRKESGGLFARIEGNDKGKPRGIDFPYKRVPCE